MRKGYYVASALLLLATVPMYIRIFSESRRESVSPAAEVQRPVVRYVHGKTYYFLGEQLPEGYRCSGGGGTVYRTRQHHGATVIEPLVVSGVHVRCETESYYTNRPGMKKPLSGLRSE